jgi:hypothetical protein
MKGANKQWVDDRSREEEREDKKAEMQREDERSREVERR